MIIEKFFASRESMFLALKEACESQLRLVLGQYDRTTMLVSGGATPEPLYYALSDSDIDWSRVDIALVDERWVESEHHASNERFIRRSLLQHRAKAAKFTAMKNNHSSALLGLEQCESQYRELSQPVSLCILGMGGDGHTASWFPHADGLSEALTTQKNCVSIQAQASEVTGFFTERMSISLATVKRCKHVILVLTGDEKRQVYEKALKHCDMENFPVAAVLDGSFSVSVYWAP